MALLVAYTKDNKLVKRSYTSYEDAFKSKKILAKTGISSGVFNTITGREIMSAPRNKKKHDESSNHNDFNRLIFG